MEVNKPGGPVAPTAPVHYFPKPAMHMKHTGTPMNFDWVHVLVLVCSYKVQVLQVELTTRTNLVLEVAEFVFSTKILVGNTCGVAEFGLLYEFH